MLKSKESFAAVRFEGFELDLHSGELRKDGTPTVRLPDQSFQILAMLLEHAGKVVSRREIQEQLWPDGTVVEFEHSIGAAMNRLRQVLGDSADNPKFIETLPRRGYKFIATVEGTGPDGHKPAVVSRSIKRKNLLAIASISVVVLLLLVGVIGWRSLPRKLRVTNVAKITNDANAKITMTPAASVTVTDGVHLYFVEGTPGVGGSRLAQVSAIGGETTQVATSLREVVGIFDISPNFSHVLVANGASGPPDPATGRAGGAAEVWAQPLPSGTSHRVGNFYATGACYSPDGQHILYADGHALIAIDTDGTNPHEVARVEGIVQGLRYSPDGKRIRFHIMAWPGDGSSLWEMDANGNGLHALLPNWKESPFQCCGNWSPDGRYYVFRAGQGNEQAIWLMPEHRLIFAGGHGSPTRLISGPLRLSNPVPSADGTKLFVLGEELRVEAVRYDSKTQRFESYLDGISISSLGFSHDRKWIAYVSYPDMNLWRSRVDGTDKMQLTFPPVRAYGPRWSPDGSRIAFTDVRFGGPWTVALVSASGGPPQSFGPGGDPDWLPDGKSFVYFATSNQYDKPWAGIFRRDLDSGRISPIPNSEGRFSPRVSPDGRYIAAFSQAGTEVLLFDSEINKWSILAKGGFSYNLWSHDGKFVYTRGDHAGSPTIVRIRIPDGRIEEVVSLKDLPQVVDIFAGWIGLTPEGDPLVIRDRGVQEIYALDLR